MIVQASEPTGKHRPPNTDTLTQIHTHTYIYIYIYIFFFLIINNDLFWTMGQELPRKYCIYFRQGYAEQPVHISTVLKGFTCCVLANNMTKIY